jgi:hypothetical protein
MKNERLEMKEFLPFAPARLCHSGGLCPLLFACNFAYAFFHSRIFPC